MKLKIKLAVVILYVTVIFLAVLGIFPAPWNNVILITSSLFWLIYYMKKIIPNIKGKQEDWE